MNGEWLFSFREQMPESFPLVFVYVKIYIPYMQDTYLFDTLFIKLYFLCTLELHVAALGEVVCVWGEDSHWSAGAAEEAIF